MNNLLHKQGRLNCPDAGLKLSQGRGGGVTRVLYIRGHPNDIFGSIRLGQKEVFSKFDNSRSKLTKKSLLKAIFRHSVEILHRFVKNL